MPDVYIQFPQDTPHGADLNGAAGGISLLPNRYELMSSDVKVENLAEYPIINDLAFFWKDITKNQEKMLMENEAIGNFILRKSSSDPSALTLVVKSYDLNFLVQIRHFRSPEETWAISSNAPRFSSIVTLVEHYKKNDFSTSPYLPHVASSSLGEDSAKGSTESQFSTQTKYFVRLRDPVNRDVSSRFFQPFRECLSFVLFRWKMILI